MFGARFRISAGIAEFCEFPVSSRAFPGFREEIHHALYRLGLDGGVMVTGSHNPRSDNGLKMCLGTGPFWGDDIVRLRERLEAGVAREPATSTGQLRDEAYKLRKRKEQVVADWKTSRRDGDADAG